MEVMKKLFLSIILILLSFNLSANTYKNWTSFTHIDEMDDGVRMGAYTESLNKISYRRAKLYVFCENGEEVKAYISDIGYYPSHNSPFKVDLRADKNPVVNDKWTSLSRKDGVWKHNATDLVKIFKKANNVIIRTDSGINGADTWSFSASGFTKTMGKATQQCAAKGAKDAKELAAKEAKELVAKESWEAWKLKFDNDAAKKNEPLNIPKIIKDLETVQIEFGENSAEYRNAIKKAEYKLK